MTGKRLTAAEVDSAALKPGLHSDGGNLYLRVGKDGGRSWAFIYRYGGRQREAGLGKAGKDHVTLANARREAKKGRALLDGRPAIDPLTVWRAPETSVMTFAQAFQNYVALHESKWSAEHARQWRVTVETYCRPLFKMPIDQIDTAAVLRVLAPIWNRIPETANRVRNRIEIILDFAKTDDETRPNPARWRGHLSKKLPKPKDAGKHVKQDGALVRVERGNHAALPFADIPRFAARLRAESGVGPRALELLLLSSGRAGEVLNAEWREFDFVANVWTIPWQRLKTGKRVKRPHRIPLCGRAIAILEEMRAIAASRFVFPGRFPGRPLGHNALLILFKRLSGADLTVHGLRSSFRDYVGEKTAFSAELAELALQHKITGTEGRYRRGDGLEQRVAMMNAWSAYCSSGDDGADNVLPFTGCEERSAQTS